MKILHFCWTTLENKITFWTKMTQSFKGWETISLFSNAKCLMLMLWHVTPRMYRCMEELTHFTYLIRKQWDNGNVIRATIPFQYYLCLHIPWNQTLKYWNWNKQLCTRHFQVYFLDANIGISTEISLKFVLCGPLYNTSALIQVRTRPQTGNMP